MTKRKIPMSYGSHVTGLYPSKKGAGEGLAYESALERDCIIRLDADPTVLKIEMQPLQIPYVDARGKRREYTPDILACYANRRPRLIEVKYLATLRRDIEKFRDAYVAATQYAQERGWSFRLATERFVRRDAGGALLLPTTLIVGNAPLRIQPGEDVAGGDGAVYRIIRILDIERVLVQPRAGGTPLTLAVSDLCLPSDADGRVTALEGITDEEWEDAERKYALIKPLLESNPRTAAMVKKVAEQAGTSVATIYNWITAHGKTGQAVSLLPKRRKDKGDGRLSEEIETIVKEVMESEYLHAQRRSVKTVWRIVWQRCQKDGLMPPHESTLRRRVRALSAKTVVRRRFGANAARRLNMTPGRFPGAQRALDVAQMDHAQLDVILVDEKTRDPIGRPWLTMIIDVFSRAVLGFHLSLESPGAASAGACVVNAVLPKEKLLARFPAVSGRWGCWGKPRKLHMDNAGEFRGRMMRMACTNHGIGLEWRPVRRPEYGGHIERMMGTVMREIHELPGSTHGSPKARGERDPEKSATMSMCELEKWLTVFIVEVYHCRSHGETGRPPMLLYEESVLSSGHLPEKESDEERLRIDFLPVMTRSVQRRGIVIDGIYYYHPRLEALREGERKAITLRRDPYDISRIYYHDDALGGYLTIPYADLRRPPMNIWDLRKVRKALKETAAGEISEKQIFEGYEKMRAMEDAGNRETMRVRRARARRRPGDERASENIKAPSDVGDVEERQYEDYSGIEIRPYEDIEKLI